MIGVVHLFCELKCVYIYLQGLLLLFGGVFGYDNTESALWIVNPGKEPVQKYDELTDLLLKRNFSKGDNHMVCVMVKHAHLECCRSVFAASLIRRKSKDWLAWKQDNVSERSDMSGHDLVGFTTAYAISVYHY